jgi:hypothetical protein
MLTSVLSQPADYVVRFVALAWKDPNNITEELVSEVAKKGK